MTAGILCPENWCTLHRDRNRRREIRRGIEGLFYRKLLCLIAYRVIRLTQNVEDHGLSDRCSVICGNALEQDYSNATAFFLYLIPRGLRLILPVLRAINKPVKVVTYMSPLPEVIADNIVKVSTAGHAGAEWPIYVYTLNTPSSAMHS